MQPDLVFLLCDTARADAFSPWDKSRSTPTVERLASEGILYENAVAAAPWTVPSTASIFTGLLPTEHGITGECVEWMHRAPTTPAPCVSSFGGSWLPEELLSRGYRTWAASCNSWVSQWGGFDRGFEEFVDVRPWAPLDTHSRKNVETGPLAQVERFGRRIGYRSSRALGRLDRGGGAAALRFEGRLREADSAPLFAFVNLMETHAPLDPPKPWYPYPGWRRFRTVRLLGEPDQGLSFNAGFAEPAAGEAETIQTLYYSCAAYEDSVLGRFLDSIERAGRPTVIVLLADHGEHLGESGLFGHNSSLRQPVLHVPLVVWDQGVDFGSGRVSEPVSLTELAGWAISLAEGVGPGPLQADERPLISEYEGTEQHNGIPDRVREWIRTNRPDVPALVFHPGMAVREGPLKFVAVGNGEQHLYDVSSDPGEERDILEERPEQAGPFTGFREEWLERRDRSGPDHGTGAAADGEIAAHLRELGYME